MSLRNVLMLMVLVAVCGLVSVGCAKKPKVDLSALRAGGNGGQTTMNGGIDDDNWGAGDFGGDDEMGNLGAWGDLNDPISGGSATDFLMSSERWNEVVYFAYDRSELLASERPKVEALAVYLQSNPGTGAVVEGHCDERGSDEYNRALSERRALSVVEYLKALGVADNRLRTVSYGEERPVISNAKSDAEHSKNRRAEFLFGTMK